MSAGYEFRDIDALMEEASWETINILRENYDELESGRMRNIAVYYFLENGRVSSLSDALIEGLTTQIANAISYEDIQVRMVSRTNLDQILRELAFQSSDLVDPQTQIAVGKQLGVEIIVTGTVSTVEKGKRLNVQLIEVQTAAVLGGYIMYLLREQ